MSRDLCDRTFRFSCEVAAQSARLQYRNLVIRRLSMKLLDSATSIGANLEEAQGGQTKPDFIAKNFIALKEARETRYWIRLIAEADPGLKDDLEPLLRETDELIAILTALLKTARSSPSRGAQILPPR